MLANWVKESTATTGTGAITLGGAPAGFVPFSAAFSDGARVSYAIEDGNNREIGIGTYSAGVLTRTTVLETLVAGTFTRGGAATALSGAATVMVTMEASLTEEGKGVEVWLQSTTAHFDVPDNYGGIDSNSGSTLVADRFYSVDALLIRRRKISKLFIDVKTLDAAATQLAAGIYSIDPATGLADNILTEVMFNATATGPQGITVPGGPIILEPGWYALGFVCNAAPQILKAGLGALSPSLTGVARFDNYRRGGRRQDIAAGWSSLPTAPGIPTTTGGGDLLVLMWN